MNSPPICYQNPRGSCVFQKRTCFLQLKREMSKKIKIFEKVWTVLPFATKIRELRSTWVFGPGVVRWKCNRKFGLGNAEVQKQVWRKNVNYFTCWARLEAKGTNKQRTMETPIWKTTRLRNQKETKNKPKGNRREPKRNQKETKENQRVTKTKPKGHQRNQRESKGNQHETKRKVLFH